MFDPLDLTVDLTVVDPLDLTGVDLVGITGFDLLDLTVDLTDLVGIYIIITENNS